MVRMRAVVISQFGGPDVLHVVERPQPQAERGEVVVAVRAAALNRADLLQRRGLYPAPPDVPADIPGMDFAGDVAAVGSGVTDWAIGDRVFGLVGGGAYAEALVTSDRALAPIPTGLSYVEAAAAPEAFITAYDAMVTQAELRAGESVLISAVGSGVGTAAVQLARAVGAHVLGTARTADKLTRARALGLNDAIVANDARFAQAVKAATGGRGVDVVLELVGGDYVAEDLACLSPKGRIVVVGLLAGAKASIDLGVLLHRRAVVRGTVLRARPLEEKLAAVQAFRRHVVPLLASGRVKAIVDRVFPLAQAPAAHRWLEENNSFGKVALDCAVDR
ncbi:MAG TPA: NAD(P)H-quinone oxidoreductase [Polyangia bacterium]|jgi:putative PIG3 family NAD(P)H quinone oxidoreductase|nr:NAD(P)H-quinone oxidoreductase [Polyangia bacterium]